MKKNYLLSLLCILPLVIFGQVFQIEKIVASDRTAQDQFGFSTSISGNYAVVGVPFNNTDANEANSLSNAGAAHVYEVDETGNWIHVQKIVASDRTANDSFGFTVSISGDYILAGARFNATDASGGNSLPVCGAAYIFERDGSGNWTEVQKIVSSDRAIADLFATSVSVSGDYAIVGAPNESEDTSGSNTLSASGSAYIFERDGGGTWLETQKIVASDRAASDSFGSSVSISGDYLVVGVQQEDEDASGMNTLNAAGSAYIFERDGSGTWTEVQKIVASERAAVDFFGCSVSISGDYIVVGAFQEDEDASGANTLEGAGAAYIFERDGSGTWLENQKIVANDRASGANFANLVSISGDYALVSAAQEHKDEFAGAFASLAGAAYLFIREGNGTWSQVQKLVASDRTGSDSFGYSVSTSDKYLIVGAINEDHDAAGGNSLNNAGSAYIFDRYDIVYNFGVWSGGSGGSGTPSSVDGVKNTIVVGGSPTLSSATALNKLVIGSGASLTVPVNGLLTVNDELGIHEAEGLIIKSDADGTGNLITNGDLSYKNDGTVKVERYIPYNGGNNLEPYHYISTPVSDQATFTDMTGLYAYRESDLTWVHHEDALSGFSSFSAGVGYAINYGSATTKSFIGSLNTGSQQVGVTSTSNGGSVYEHFNLLGNPYPSSISAVSFVTENSSLLSNNVYFWNGVDYSTYNTSLGSGTAGGLGAVPDGNIAVGQAFFVEATSSGNVSFTTAMRGSDSDIFYKTVSYPQLRLLVTSGEEQSDLLLTGHQMSSAGADEYDAKQLEGAAGLSLGSLINDRAYDIESVPEFSGNEFNLVVNASELKSVTFQIKDFIGLEDKHVYLEDREQGIVTDLSEAKYAASINKGKNSNRFKLTIGEKSSDNRVWVSEGNVYVYKGQESLKGTIVLSGLDGRLLDTSNTNRIECWSILPSGIYLLTIYNDQERYTTKLIKQ